MNGIIHSQQQLFAMAHLKAAGIPVHAFVLKLRIAIIMIAHDV